MSELKDNLENILNIKESLIVHGNIKNGVTLFGVPGTLKENIIDGSRNVTTSFTTSNNATEFIKQIISLDGVNLNARTSLYYCFYNFINLETVKNLRTNSASNMSYMFFYCSKLKNLDIFDTSKATNMQNMFSNCSNLSNDSLNNIMQMCINASSYTGTKTLAQLGLTSSQASTCQNLSNYSDFVTAGWTTGY